MGKSPATARLIAVVTALMLVMPAARGEAASVDQLVTIDQMLSNQDWDALTSYLGQHPELMMGEGALALHLRAFMSAMNEGTIEEFAARAGEIERPANPY